MQTMPKTCCPRPQNFQPLPLQIFKHNITPSFISCPSRSHSSPPEKHLASCSQSSHCPDGPIGFTPLHPIDFWWHKMEHFADSGIRPPTNRLLDGYAVYASPHHSSAACSKAVEIQTSWFTNSVGVHTLATSVNDTFKLSNASITVAFFKRWTSTHTSTFLASLFGINQIMLMSIRLPSQDILFLLFPLRPTALTSTTLLRVGTSYWTNKGWNNLPQLARR